MQIYAQRLLSGLASTDRQTKWRENVTALATGDAYKWFAASLQDVDVFRRLFLSAVSRSWRVVGGGCPPDVTTNERRFQLVSTLVSTCGRPLRRHLGPFSRTRSGPAARPSGVCRYRFRGTYLEASSGA